MSRNIARPLRAAATTIAVVSLIGSVSMSASRATTPSQPRSGGTVAGAPTLSDDQGALIASLQGDLDSLSQRSSPDDPQYFANGVWYSSLTDCFRCMVAPAVAAAAVSQATGNTNDASIAKQTFDTVIADSQSQNGAFGPADEFSPDIETALTANELGETYIILYPQLTEQERASWAAAMGRAADYLVEDGNLAWYTNGNISLANALTMRLAYLVTGQARFESDYESALSFVIAPPQSRWPGDGLQITTTPTAPDDSDGAAYFSETGPGGTGFDADYTQVQLDVATWLALVDPSNGAKLLNLLLNQELPRVNSVEWTLDTSNGTRHLDANRFVGFQTGGLTVAALREGRTGFDDWVGPQLSAMQRSISSICTYSNDGLYFDLASEAAPALMTLTSAVASGTRRTPVEPGKPMFDVKLDPANPRTLSFYGEVANAEVGSRIDLQRHDRGRWRLVKASALVTGGGYTFSLRHAPRQAARYRSYLPAQFGSRARSSRPRKVKM